MCILYLQNFIIVFYKPITMNTLNHQVLKIKSGDNYDSKSLFLKGYDFSVRSENN